METLQFFLLQIQCIAILFTLWKMRKWLLNLEKKQNLYYEGYQSLFKAYEQSNEMNKEIVKLLEDHNYKIAGLNERLKNTEECYRILENRFNNSEIVYTGGCDPANGNTTIIKTIIENEQEKGE